MPSGRIQTVNTGWEADPYNIWLCLAEIRSLCRPTSPQGDVSTLTSNLVFNCRIWFIVWGDSRLYHVEVIETELIFSAVDSLNVQFLELTQQTVGIFSYKVILYNHFCTNKKVIRLVGSTALKQVWFFHGNDYMGSGTLQKSLCMNTGHRVIHKCKLKCMNEKEGACVNKYCVLTWAA